MVKIEEYAQLVREMTREEFAASHAHPFLLLHLEEDEDRAEWTFKTTTISSKRFSIAARDGGLSEAASRYRAFPLVKSAGNPWRERISIGRARNNDIVLPHKSVSKLHAHFTQTEDGRLLLADAGSRNGTRLNSERLVEGASLEAKPGDTITLGGVTLQLIDAGVLHDTIKAQLS